ncbi:chitinase [Streptomyces sp. MAR4 CNX-425]|uniref:chitinase n=1 Tax=Streptomyces sp. MAR4 CNX-425 TaxID=3406343 RepID=UPI003B51466A
MFRARRPRPLRSPRTARSARTAFRRLAVAAAGGLLATLLGTPAATGAAANLVQNPGFESGLSGWTCSGTAPTTVTSPVRSGTGALRATPAGQDNARCTQTVAVRPDSAYELSAWVQGSYTYLGASGTGTTDVSTWTAGASSYSQLTTSFTTGPDTTSVTIYTHGWYGQPAYHADDVSLTGPGGDPGTIPATPTGLEVTGTAARSVSLGWSPVAEATGYQVYRDGTKVLSTSGASATVTGLTPSTAYEFRVTATNAAGESPRSAPVTATTTPDDGGGGQVPKHAVTGYWQNFDNGATVQTIREVQNQYDIIAVAFADATTTPGAVTFNLDSAGLGGYTVPQFKQDIAAKQQDGKSVIISVGGEKGRVSVGSSAAAANFADSVYALMQEYGFDGVDIDLENGLNPTYMTEALRRLSQLAGPDLVITMAPQTIDMQSTAGSYFQTALNIKDILTVVNMQYYNSGTMLGCDGGVYAQGTINFLTALACIQLEGGLAPSQVGLGLPASTRAAGGGYTSPAVVNNALDCLTRGTNCGSFKPPRTYPDLRGAMTWSTNWDATAGNSWSSAVGPHVHALP